MGLEGCEGLDLVEEKITARVPKDRSFQACPKENEKYVIVSQSTNVVRPQQGLCKVACLTVCEIEAGPFVMGDTAETVLHSLGL